MTRYVRIEAQGTENQAFLLGLFAEAGYSVDRFSGGNAFYVPSDLELSDEQKAELVAAVRPGTLPAQFVPSGEGAQPASSGPAATAADLPAGEAETEQGGVPDPPPKAGPGSSRDTWATYAEDELQLEVVDSMTRDEIIAVVERRLAELAEAG